MASGPTDLGGRWPVAAGSTRESVRTNRSPQLGSRWPEAGWPRRRAAAISAGKDGGDTAAVVTGKWAQVGCREELDT